MTDVATMNPDPKDPAWLVALLRLGALTCIALYLVWWATDRVDSRFDVLEAASRRQDASDAVSVQLLRAICYGVTPDPATQKAMCEVGR